MAESFEPGNDSYDPIEAIERSRSVGTLNPTFLDEYKRGRRTKDREKSIRDLESSINSLNKQLQMMTKNTQRNAAQNRYSGTEGSFNQAIRDQAINSRSSSSSLTSKTRIANRNLDKMNMSVMELTNASDRMLQASDSLSESIVDLEKVNQVSGKRLNYIVTGLENASKDFSLGAFQFSRGVLASSFRGAGRLAKATAKAPFKAVGAASGAAYRTSIGPFADDGMAEIGGAYDNFKKQLSMGMMGAGNPLLAMLLGTGIRVGSKPIRMAGRGVANLTGWGADKGKDITLAGFGKLSSQMQEFIMWAKKMPQGSNGYPGQYNVVPMTEKQIQKEIEQSAGKGLYHISPNGELSIPKSKSEPTSVKVKKGIGGSYTVALALPDEKGNKKKGTKEEYAFVESLKEAMRSIFLDAKTGILSTFGTPGGISSVIGFALPIFGLGYKSEIPNVKRYGLFGGMFKVLSMIYVHGRFAADESNELMIQQMEILMKGFGIEGTIQRPRARSLAQWLGQAIGDQFKTTFGGKDGILTYLKESAQDKVKGMIKGGVEILKDVANNKGSGLSSLIPGYDDWKKQKKEQDEFRASPTLKTRMGYLKSMTDHLQVIRLILASSWLINQAGPAVDGGKSIPMKLKMFSSGTAGSVTQTGIGILHEGEEVHNTKTMTQRVASIITEALKRIGGDQSKKRANTTAGATASESASSAAPQSKKKGFLGTLFGGLFGGGFFTKIKDWFASVKNYLKGIYSSLTGDESSNADKGINNLPKKQNFFNRMYESIANKLEQEWNSKSEDGKGSVRKVWEMVFSVPNYIVSGLEKRIDLLRDKLNEDFKSFDAKDLSLTQKLFAAYKEVVPKVLNDVLFGENIKDMHQDDLGERIGIIGVILNSLKTVSNVAKILGETTSAFGSSLIENSRNVAIELSAIWTDKEDSVFVKIGDTMFSVLEGLKDVGVKTWHALSAVMNSVWEMQTVFRLIEMAKNPKSTLNEMGRFGKKEILNELAAKTLGGVWAEIAQSINDKIYQVYISGFVSIGNVIAAAINDEEEIQGRKIFGKQIKTRGQAISDYKATREGKNKIVTALGSLRAGIGSIFGAAFQPYIALITETYSDVRNLLGFFFGRDAAGNKNYTLADFTSDIKSTFDNIVNLGKYTVETLDRVMKIISGKELEDRKNVAGSGLTRNTIDRRIGLSYGATQVTPEFVESFKGRTTTANSGALLLPMSKFGFAIPGSEEEDVAVLAKKGETILPTHQPDFFNKLSKSIGDGITESDWAKQTLRKLDEISFLLSTKSLGQGSPSILGTLVSETIKLPFALAKTTANVIGSIVKFPFQAVIAALENGFIGRTLSTVVDTIVWTGKRTVDAIGWGIDKVTTAIGFVATKIGSLFTAIKTLAMAPFKLAKAIFIKPLEFISEKLKKVTDFFKFKMFKTVTDKIREIRGYHVIGVGPDGKEIVAKWPGYIIDRLTDIYDINVKMYEIDRERFASESKERNNARRDSLWSSLSSKTEKSRLDNKEPGAISAGISSGMEGVISEVISTSLGGVVSSKIASAGGFGKFLKGGVGKMFRGVGKIAGPIGIIIEAVSTLSQVGAGISSAMSSKEGEGISSFFKAFGSEDTSGVGSVTGKILGAIIGGMLGGPPGIALGAWLGGFAADKLESAIGTDVIASWFGSESPIYKTVDYLLGKVSGMFSTVGDLIGEFPVKMIGSIPVIGPFLKALLDGKLMDDAGQFNPFEFSMAVAENIPVIGPMLVPAVKKAFGYPSDDTTDALNKTTKSYSAVKDLFASLPEDVQNSIRQEMKEKSKTFEGKAVSEVAPLRAKMFEDLVREQAKKKGIIKHIGGLVNKPDSKELKSALDNSFSMFGLKDDEVPSILQTGEFVVPKDKVDITLSRMGELFDDIPGVKEYKTQNIKESTFGNLMKSFKNVGLNIKSLVQGGNPFKASASGFVDTLIHGPAVEAPTSGESFADLETSTESQPASFWERVKKMIKVHEGLNLSRYSDSRGFPTIGYGHLIKPEESAYLTNLTKEGADQLFEKDFAAHAEMAMSVPGFAKLDDYRKAALIDMTFNLGPAGIKKFTNMLSALQAGDYDTASQEVLRSAYASQVGKRAQTIAKLIKLGDKSGVLSSLNDSAIQQASNSNANMPMASLGTEPIISGNVVWPPVDGRYTSAFGMRPPVPGVPTASTNHKGVDIGPPVPGTVGTPIRAVMAGQVSYAGQQRGYGNIVIIDHPDGKQTAYAHQSAIGVKAGDQVSAGQVIGALGNTGKPGMKPHLHFEVRQSGQPIDPESVFGKLSPMGSQMVAGSLSSSVSSPDTKMEMASASVGQLPKGVKATEKGGPSLMEEHALTSTEHLANSYSGIKNAEQKSASALNADVMDKVANRFEQSNMRNSEKIEKMSNVITIAINATTNAINSKNSMAAVGGMGGGREVADDIGDILLGPGRGSGSYI